MISLAYYKPKEVEINGNTYPIDLSFDNVIRVLDLMKEDGFTEEEKIELAMNVLLDCNVFEEDPDCQPDEFIEGFQFILDEFILNNEFQGVPLDLQGNPMPIAKKKEVYSLTHDADYIFASFLQAYGMDLIDLQGELEWDKFNALLAGLPSDTKFKEVIEIRQRPFAKGKGSQEENRQLRELKEVYKLPGHNAEEGG